MVERGQSSDPLEPLSLRALKAVSGAVSVMIMPSFMRPLSSSHPPVAYGRAVYPVGEGGGERDYDGVRGKAEAPVGLQAEEDRYEHDEEAEGGERLSSGPQRREPFRDVSGDFIFLYAQKEPFYRRLYVEVHR